MELACPYSVTLVDETSEMPETNCSLSNGKGMSIIPAKNHQLQDRLWWLNIEKQLKTCFPYKAKLTRFRNSKHAPMETKITASSEYCSPGFRSLCKKP